MRPDIEVPSVIPDEVRMPVGDAAVVDRLVLADVEALLHGHGASIAGAEQVARLEQARFQPALAHDVERMLARGADQLAAGVQVPDAARALKQFLDPFPAAGMARLALRLAPDLVADLQILDTDPAATREQLGACGEAGVEEGGGAADGPQQGGARRQVVALLPGLDGVVEVFKQTGGTLPQLSKVWADSAYIVGGCLFGSRPTAAGC